ncbi:MAG: GumC family protein [Candidatus Methylomirabilales bacterium]
MEEDIVRPIDYFRVIWKRKGLIVLLAVVTVIAAVVVSLMMPRVYETKATVLIIPPIYKSEISIEALPVDIYKQLAITSSVLYGVIKKLNLKDEVTGEELSVEDLDGMLEVNVVERGGQTGPVTSALMFLNVKGNKPRMITDIANTWGEIVAEESRKIRVSESASIARVIQEQYESTREKLIKAEDRLRDFREGAKLEVKRKELDIKRSKLANYQTQLLDLTVELKTKETIVAKYEEQLRVMERDGQWSGIIRDGSEIVEKTSNNYIKRGIEDARGNLIDAEEKLQNFRKRYPLNLSRKELEIKRGWISEYETKVINVKTNLKVVQDRLKELKKQIKDQPETLVLSKAITDDALWQKLSLEKRELEKITTSKLSSETINPVYIDLQAKIVDTQIESDTLLPQITHLEELLEKTKADARELELIVSEWELELEHINKNHALAKSNYEKWAKRYDSIKFQHMDTQVAADLLAAKVDYVEGLVKEKEKDIEGLERYIAEKELQKERLEREVSTLKGLFNTLSKKVEEARIAEAEKTSDVKFIASAVEPRVPVGPKKKMNVLLAGTFGLMFSLFLAFFVEFIEKERVEEKKRRKNDD